MAFFENILNGVKNIGQNLGQGVKNMRQNINNFLNPAQNSNIVQNPIIEGVSRAQNTIKNQNIVPNIQTNTNNSPLMAGVNQVRNNNWKNSLGMAAANMLLGIGRSNFDSNKSTLDNIINGAAKGLQNYNDYNVAKNVYSQYGIDTNTLSPYADYSGYTPAAMLAAGAKMKQNQVKQEIANTEDKTKRQKMIFDAVNNGYMSPEEGQLQLKALDFDTNLQNSNNTRRTNSLIDVNNAKTEKTKAETKQVGKPKVSISIRKGGTKSTVDIRHNGGSGSSGNNTSYVKDRKTDYKTKYGLEQ